MLRRGKSYDTVRGIKEVWEKCYEIPVPSCGSITEVTFEECPIEQIGLAKQRRNGILTRGNSMERSIEM